MTIRTCSVLLKLALGFVVFVMLGACASQQQEPVVASSSDQAGYAERYPASLAEARERLAEQEAEAQELVGQFSTYPEALKDPSWVHVGVMVERADEAGRSGTYAERAQSVAAVQRFFREEEKEINRQLGGSVAYVAKQEGCEADVYSAAIRGMNKAIDKQAEERLRANSAAHRYIEESQDALGQQNLETLEKQADQIVRASYLANVASELTRRELEALLEEAKEIESTLDRTIEEQTQAKDDPDRSDKEKEVAAQRLEAASEAKSRVSQEVKDTEQLLSTVEEGIASLRDSYEQALEALTQAIEEQAEAAAGAEQTAS